LIFHLPLFQCFAPLIHFKVEAAFILAGGGSGKEEVRERVTSHRFPSPFPKALAEKVSGSFFVVVVFCFFFHKVANQQPLRHLCLLFLNTPVSQ